MTPKDSRAGGDADRFALLADALLDEHFEYMDLDAGDREALLIEAGLLVNTVATAEDAEEEWAQEFDIKEGDACVKLTPDAYRVIARAIELRKTPGSGERR